MNKLPSEYIEDIYFAKRGTSGDNDGLWIASILQYLDEQAQQKPEEKPEDEQTFMEATSNAINNLFKPEEKCHCGENYEGAIHGKAKCYLKPKEEFKLGIQRNHENTGI